MVIEAPAPPQELQGRKALWDLTPHVDPELAAQIPDVTRMVVHLLYERGYRSPDEIREFLTGPPAEHDPFLLPDMTKAVARIREAAANGERVAVWGDFDADGLTAAAVFLDTLRLLGIEPTVIIPTRDEGHGMAASRMPGLAEQGIKLLVTADCGISDMEAVAEARAQGMDVIITDHHQPSPDGVLPDALVISPTRRDSVYPFARLAGSGVAYKVARALLEVPDRYEPLLDLVALGTIADVVPLRDENRGIVIRGLKRLRATERCGLRALFRVAGVDSRSLDGISVGFYLGPRINAANRMADPRIAFDLITATDTAVADGLAAQLDSHNSSRQEQVELGIKQVIESVGQPLLIKEAIRDGTRDPIICVTGNWGPGISGLLASNLTERYCVPAMVGSPKGDGVMAVSARSVRGVSVLGILEAAHEACPEAFVGRGGGHAAACGFRTTPEKVDLAFRQLGLAAREVVPTDDLIPRIMVDAQVSLRQMGREALERVEELAPYGHDFPEPTFLARGICLSGKQTVGAGGRHLKMTARAGNHKISAIIFNQDPEIADTPEDRPVDIVFNLQRDEINGMYRPQINIRDWRFSDGGQGGDS